MMSWTAGILKSCIAVLCDIFFTLLHFGRWCETVPPETLLVLPPLELPRACRGKMVSNRIQRGKFRSCPKTGIKQVIVVVFGFFIAPFGFFLFVFFCLLFYCFSFFFFFISVFFHKVWIRYSPASLSIHFRCSFYSDSYERTMYRVIEKKKLFCLSCFQIVDWNKVFLQCSS